MAGTGMRGAGHLLLYRLDNDRMAVPQQKRSMPRPEVDESMAIDVPLVSAFRSVDVDGERLHVAQIMGHAARKDRPGFFEQSARAREFLDVTLRQGRGRESSSGHEFQCSGAEIGGVRTGNCINDEIGETGALRRFLEHFGVIWANVPDRGKTGSWICSERISKRFEMQSSMNCFACVVSGILRRKANNTQGKRTDSCTEDAQNRARQWRRGRTPVGDVGDVSLINMTLP